MQSRRLVLLAVTLISSGCFATRNDVRILQGDIFAARAEAARADSAHAKRMQEIITTLGGTLAALNDSVRETNARLVRFQGETRTDVSWVRDQIIIIQELLGQSARRIAELRAATEERTQTLMSMQPAPAPTAPGDTTRPAAPPAAEGPYQLWQMADDQWRRGSPGTARMTLMQLLANYPNEATLAPQAAVRIAETFDREGKTSQADSAYREVLAKYPRSDKAATASYKLALLLEKQGKCAEAIQQIDQLRRLFPLADEVRLAENYRCPRQ